MALQSIMAIAEFRVATKNGQIVRPHACGGALVTDRNPTGIKINKKRKEKIAMKHTLLAWMMAMTATVVTPVSAEVLEIDEDLSIWIGHDRETKMTPCRNFIRDHFMAALNATHNGDEYGLGVFEAEMMWRLGGNFPDTYYFVMSAQNRYAEDVTALMETNPDNYGSPEAAVAQIDILAQKAADRVLGMCESNPIPFMGFNSQ